ncbi:MAG: hypothetical protein JXQ80_10585 [Bacteroidales bacterium]|nr:hypothetical protein [Bacteroidales bacterium]
MAFLRTLLIIIVIFYVVRLFTRYILPALFTNYMDSKMKEFSKRQQRHNDEARKHEGEVTIDYHPGNKGKDKPSKGEYTDYVEVKD